MNVGTATRHLVGAGLVVVGSACEEGLLGDEDNEVVQGDRSDSDDRRLVAVDDAVGVGEAVGGVGRHVDNEGVMEGQREVDSTSSVSKAVAWL